jgi:probable DNA repair protein
VLTASRRLAHALRLSYAAQAQARGLTVWRTPQILPWTTWLRAQWVEARARENPPDARRLLTSAQARVLWERVLSESRLTEELLNASDAARVAARSWQRLNEYLIDREALRSFDSLEARALYEWSRAFERRLDTLGAIEESQLAAWAWNTHLTPTQPLVFAGFDVFTPSVARLIERWREQGCVKLDDRTSARGDVRVVGLLDRDAEIETAARWARAQIEAGARKVAIVVDSLQTRSEEVRRSLEEILVPAARDLASGMDPMHAPFVVAAPQPLARYPLVDAALLILRLLSGEADSELVGRLLRSPFLVASQSERDARALADARLRREQRARWSAYELERFAALCACKALSLAAREAATLHRALPHRALPSVWAERFHALLAAFGWPGERTRTSVEQQTMVKFQAALTELGSLDGLAGPLTFDQACSELARLVTETPFEPETPPAFVTVIDATTVAGMEFDCLWVAGLDATHWPAPANPDPLIPLPLQRRAGVAEATAASSLQLSKQKLERLMGSARNVVLSWPQRDGDAELEASPLLRGLPRATSAELPMPSARDVRSRLFEARPALEVLRDDRAPTLAEAHTRGGARILELQAQCPFRAQATLRLHAEPLERLGPGFNARLRGTYLHRVLEALWAELRDHEGLHAHSSQALREVVQRIAERTASSTLVADLPQHAPLMRLEVESVVERVCALLEIDRQRPPFRVRRTEGEETISIAGLTIRLQPDRIDEVEGGVFLIDYKLGDAHTPRKWLDSAPGRPEQPQLPLYALALDTPVVGLAFATLAPGSIEYRGWHNGTAIAPGVLQFPGKVRRATVLPPDWAALFEHWREVLTNLATQYVQGEAAVDPLRSACTYCHLSTFCRVHEREALDDDEGELDE